MNELINSRLRKGDKVIFSLVNYKSDINAGEINKYVKCSLKRGNKETFGTGSDASLALNFAISKIGLYNFD